MATPPERLLRQIRQLACPPAQDPAADAVLLQRFVRCRDDGAFAALVGRHGPMVLAVCRGILGDAHQAEDAFQATWLVLARKAATVRPPNRLAAWLHGVARHLALKCRRADTRRRQREARGIPPESPPDPLDELTARELLLAFAEELQQLPEVFRLPLILCCLEGRSQEEAARLLGWTPGSVKGRLERGRARLHARLARRGLGLAAALAAGEIARGIAFATAPVPTTVMARAVLAFAAGHETAGAGVPARVVALAEEGVKAMARVKVKFGIVLLLAAGVAVAGTGALAHQLLAGNQQEAKAGSVAGDADPMPPEGEKAARTDRDGVLLPAGALARLGTTRLRHAWGKVVAFSADSRTVTSIGGDEAIRIWDVASSRLLRQLPGPACDLTGSCIACSPDGSAVVVWRRTPPYLVMWDLAAGKELRTIPWSGNPPSALVFSSDGGTVAAARSDRTISLFDAGTGQERLSFPCNVRDVRQVAFSPDGKVLALASYFDGPICLFQAATGREVRRIDTKDAVLAFSPDGKSLASASRVGKSVTLWDPTTGATQATLPLLSEESSSGSAPCLTFSRDGKMLAVGGNGQPIVLWDVAARKELHRLPVSLATALVFAPDCKTVATSVLGAIRLCDLPIGNELHPSEGHKSEVTSVAISPDSRIVASASHWGNEPKICLWDATTGRLQQGLTVGNIFVREVAFAPGGRTLVVGGNGAVRLWDAVEGKQLREFSINGPNPEDARQVLAMRLAADGKTLAAVAMDFDGKVCILWTWDVATGKELVKREVANDPYFLCFAPDTKTLASAAPDQVVLEDVATGKRREIRTAQPPHEPVVFSPEGQFLAVSYSLPNPPPQKGIDTRVIGVYDLSKEGEPLTLETGPFGFVAFSPDGRYLATAGPDDLRLWELASGQGVWRRPRPEPSQADHRNAFSSLAFSPDGHSLATGMPNTTVLLWDLAPSRDAAPTDLDRLWADLAGDNGPQSYAALWALSRAPAAKVIPFIRERLPAARGPDAERLRRLLRDLDSDDFGARRAALRELEGMRDEARPALRQALTGGLSAEVRKHLEGLVAGPERLLHAGEVLRGLRAVEVLERVGTAEAQQVLQELAKGAPEARLTQEAKTSLERLARRAVPAP
jgi:RNA polymerase sigma factor (sigma-70 family)